MDSVISWSIRNRAAVIIVGALLLILGFYTGSRLPVDVFPDLTAPTVTIITEARGMAPVDLEKLVTFPLETAVNGARGVRRVRSMTTVGISVIWVEFKWAADIVEARRVVNERLSLVTPSLPENVDPPVMAPITSIMGEIQFLALSSDRHNLMELRTHADNIMRRRLLSVAGVAQVIITGGERKQYQINLSPLKLQAHSISLGEVAEAIEHSNDNITAGFEESGGARYMITGRGRFRSIEDIGSVVVRTRGTIPVLIKDLGEVSLGSAPRVGAAALRTEPAIMIGIQKQPELDEMETDLPEGMKIDRNVFRQRDFIDVAIRNVFHALRDGSILVIALMALFLANWRATVITLSAIPLSLCAAILALEFLGASINTMTLGGMAIAIGGLVDDAVSR